MSESRVDMCVIAANNCRRVDGYADFSPRLRNVYDFIAMGSCQSEIDEIGNDCGAIKALRIVLL